MGWINKVVVEHRCPTCKAITLDETDIFIEDISDISSLTEGKYCNFCNWHREMKEKTEVISILIPMKDENKKLLFGKGKKAGFV